METACPLRCIVQQGTKIKSLISILYIQNLRQYGSFDEANKDFDSKYWELDATLDEERFELGFRHVAKLSDLCFEGVRPKEVRYWAEKLGISPDTEV